MNRRHGDIAVIAVGLALAVCYGLVILLVFQKMFDAADRGDSPHVIAWGFVLMALGIAGYSTNGRSR